MAQHLGVDVDDVSAQTSLRDELGLDLIELIEVARALEGVLPLALSERELERLETYGDLETLCVLRAAPRSAPARWPAAWIHVDVPGSPRRMDRFVELTPYMAQVAADDVLRAGWRSRVDVVVASSEPDESVAWVERLFARPRARGVAVSITRGEGRPNEPAAPRYVAANATRMVQLAMRMGTLLHELQQERALACVQLTAQQPRTVADWTRQQSDADTALSHLADFFRNHEGQLPDVVREHTAAALGILSELDGVRQRVRAGNGTSAAVMHGYARLDAPLVGVARAIGSVMPDAEFGRMVKSYLALLQASESTALERSHLGAALERGALEPGQDVAIASLVAAQSSFLDLFTDTARPEVVSAFRRKAADPSFREVARLEAQAFGTSSKEGPDVRTWFRAMTTKLARLREVEEVQLAALMRRAAAIAQQT